MSRKPSWPPLVFLAVLISILAVRSSRESPRPEPSSSQSRDLTAPGELFEEQHGIQSLAPSSLTSPPTSPLASILGAISQGAPLTFTIGQSRSKPLYFRPTTNTTEAFRATIGAGQDQLEIESQQTFQGRSLLGSEQASLAIVNGQLAAHVRETDGTIQHFRSNPDTGAIESFLEQPLETTCAIDPETEIATTRSFDPLPDDPWDRAEPATIEPDPEIAASSGYNPANGNLQFEDRPIPYGRLYDQSLKDILVLVVLDKGATGGAGSSNLSSKTATYLSLMSNISAMYEHNLGLRIIVQEIILTPNTSDYSDVADGSGALSDFRSWVSSNRARGAYQWTVATKFGAVDGAGTLGIAYVSAAGGSNGVSINKTGNVNTPTHEIGHNMGSGHTSGGVMNPSINGSRSFFRDLEAQDRTSAWAIYNHMSNGGAGIQGRAFPSNRKLRHAEQIPFADDDNITTLPNQTVRFRPMDNDDTSVLHGAENELTLVEAGAVFPPGAGEVWIYGDEIEFRPAPGFTNTAWLSYTIRGSVGNSGNGWYHKGDVAIRIDSSGTNPPNLSSSTATPDFIHHSGSGALAINPLIDDHGPGHLNVNHVSPTLGISGTSDALTNGFYISSATNLSPAKGTLSLNRVDITNSGGSRVDLIRHLTFTPDAGASGPAQIQYTLVDGDGTATTQTATVLLGIDQTLLNAPAASRYDAPTSTIDATAWMQPNFDDSAWAAGSTGVGYETSTSGTLYTSLIGSNTRSQMFNGGTSAYIRIPFEVNDPADLQSLRLEMQYDDGFVAYLNGTPIHSRNAPDPISWDAVATDNHEAITTSFSSYNMTSALPQLRAGTNVLAIHGFNASSDSSDFIIRPRLVGTAKFALGGIDLPKSISIPAGVGLVVPGFLNGIAEPPFANAATIRWSSLEGEVVFADPTLPATTARFTKPGTHTLRLRISEAGYVEEHDVEVAVGAGPLVLAGPDLIIPLDQAHHLTWYSSDAATTEWQQIGGPAAQIGASGDVTFTAPGTHTFRLSATAGKITTFDDVDIVHQTGTLTISPLGSLARDLVPNAAEALSDANDKPWTAIEFDDANWPIRPALYGFERGAGYQNLFQSDLQQSMHDTNASLLVRLPFFSPLPSPLGLTLRYEDGFSAHLNGNAVARDNSPAPPLAWDATADSNHADGDAVIPQTFTAGSTIAGSNLLTIQGLNASITSSDFLLLPELRISATAVGAFQAQLIKPDAHAKFLVPTAPITNWSATGFNDSDWFSTAASIGYERSGSGNFDEHFFTDIESLSYDQNETSYLRIPFVVPENFTVEHLTIRAKYDDGFIAHLNGIEIARSNVANQGKWNSAAPTARPEALTTSFESFDLDAAIPQLEPGLNVLAIQLLNAGLTSSDLLFVPELIAELKPSTTSPYEQWFTTMPGSQGQDSSPTIDLDGDGLINLLEFAFGGIPTTAEPQNLTPDVIANRFVYRRRIDPSTAGLNYTIESSPDLQEGKWTAFVRLPSSISATQDPEIELVSIALPATSSRIYYRLRVELAQ